VRFLLCFHTHGFTKIKAEMTLMIFSTRTLRIGF
jgi:hypothetical protein